MTNTTTKKSFNKARDTLEQLCFNNILSKLYVRPRNTAVFMKTGKVPFITYCELLHDTLELAKTIPNTYNVIVGIPRSGMIPASVSSLLSGRPLSTLDSLAKNAHLRKNQKMDQAPKEYCWLMTNLEEKKEPYTKTMFCQNRPFPGVK